MKADPVRQCHRHLRVAHPGEFAELRAAALEVAPELFLVVDPKNEVLEIRIAQRRIRFHRGSVKARGLQHHAMVEQRVREYEILHRLAAVLLQQGGEQADRFPRGGLGEDARGEGKLDVDVRNLFDPPNEVCGLLVGSPIIQEMGQSFAGFPCG